MEKALLLVGKVDDIESYQILVNCNYCSINFDGKGDRDTFYEDVAAAFANNIVQARIPVCVGICNGLRINPEGCHERISKLEEDFARKFSEKVCAKLQSINPFGSIPVSVAEN